MKYRMPLFLFSISIIYTLVHFTGLENTSSYYGNVYQALYPSSFLNDEYMSPGRATMLSVFYWMVKCIGPICLDDRFLIFIYWALVFFALIALDKTIRLMGLEDFWGRMLVVAMMLVEHKFMSNHAMIVSYVDFSPTVIGSALVPWFFYGVLAEWPLFPLVILIFSIGAISLKQAWFPFLIAFVIFIKERLHRKGRILALSGFFLFCASGFACYYLFLRPPGNEHVLVFDRILHWNDNSEANPFMDSLKANILMVLFITISFFIPVAVSVKNKIRVIAVGGLFLWFLGGLYLTYAPDILKVPYLIPLNVTRALWWVQYPLFIAFTVYLVIRLKEANSMEQFIQNTFFLFILYASPFTFSSFKPPVVFVFAFGVLVGIYYFTKRFLSFALAFRMVTIALCVGSLSFYAVRGARRIDAFQFLLREGIMGDNQTARWVGINEYFKDSSPSDATVLTLVEGKDPQDRPGIKFVGNSASLRTRSGKSMVLGHYVALQFDYKKSLEHQERVEAIESLNENWRSENIRGMRQDLKTLKNPDYIVISASAFDWLNPHLDFGYKPVKTINQFIILKKMTDEEQREKISF